jgi:tetratricopeptide (TPR) repeat protein
VSGARARVLVGGLGCLVFAAAVVTFWPGVSGDFLNWDDRDNVVNNPGVHGLGRAQLQWMWSGVILGHYIPLTWMSFGLNYVLGGLNPRGYHLLNLLLHGANAVLFFLISRRLIALARPGGAEPGSWSLSLGALFSALLFAVHPLRVESVVWITERKDVLCGLFFLGAVLAYLKAVESDTLDRRWQVVSLASFAAALLAKAAAMPLPAILILLDVYPLRRARGAEGWRRILVEKIPWAILGAAGALVALRAVYTGTAVTDYARYGLGARLAMTAYTFVFYPARWFWPVELLPLYELPPEIRLLAPRFLLPALAFVGVTAVLVALRRRWPAGLAAWISSVLMLLPISGAVHSGHQLAHDRYSYLSGLGLALLFGGGLTWLLNARAQGKVSAVIARSVTAGAALIVLVLATGAWDQSKVWQDSETLWRWATGINPQCAICWNNLGTSLTDQKRHAEAEAAYRRALELRPNRATVANNVATALYGQRKYAEAEEMLNVALKLDPGLTGALMNMGALKAQEGHYAEALTYFRPAYARDPKFAELAKNFALALALEGAEQKKAGRRLEAMALYQEALAVLPGDAEARRQLDALSAEATGASRPVGR